MLKVVKYNGGKESYLPCSDPSILSKEKNYEVVYANVKDWQTNYILKGVDGEFNSVWFDTVNEFSPTYIGLTNKIPVVGKSCSIKRIDVISGKVKLTRWTTSPVKEIVNIGDVYKITTQNSTYFVQVRQF